MPGIKDRPIWIALEGIEFSGKSLQTHRLAEHYREKGLSVVQTQEPGGDEFSNRIRRDVKENPDLDYMERFGLFLVSRRHTITHIIEPAFRNGSWVIADRSEGSTFVYQGYSDSQIGLHKALRMNADFTEGTRPDLTVVVDVPVHVSMARKESIHASLPGRVNSNESRDINDKRTEMFQTWRDGFLFLAQNHRVLELRQWEVVSGDQHPDDVTQDLIKTVDNFYSRMNA